MPSTSREARALRALLLLTAAVVLAGCGGTTSSVSGAGSASSTHTPSASSTRSAASRVPGQVVRITRYGVSYEVPRGWTSLDATQVIQAQNPVIRTMAGRLGVTPQQLIMSFEKNLQAVSVTPRGAVRGILDNVNAIGTSSGTVDDDQMERQLSTLGAHPGQIRHFASPAGKAARVAYRWSTSGVTFHNEVVAVDTGRGVVTITVTSHSAAAARALGDRLQASIDRLG